MRAATTHDLGAACRAERTRRRITQAELAARTGTTRQWISGFERGRDRVETDVVLHVLVELGLTIEATPDPRRTGPKRLTVTDAAREIRRSLDDGDTVFAFRLLARAIADIRAITDPTDRSIAMSPPPSTGDHRWDTLLAAAMEREAVIAGCDVPAWTITPPLEEPWFPDPAPLLTERQIAATPPELSKRNVFLDRRGLESL